MKIANIQISNPDKILFEKGGITKLDVISYYLDVAPLMLKYIKNRPITAFRCHGGIGGECFFKKHPAFEGENVEVVNVDGQQYFFLTTIGQLIYQVQMGTIEFHIWPCKASQIDRADSMIFDLDPDEGLPIAKLRQGTRYVKNLLDELGLESNLKTSGGKGYHITVPFKRGKSWEEVGNLSLQISTLLEAKYPSLFTTNIRKNMRTGKIFIDYLRNKRGASCVAPYSLRARENATISLPIEWADLDKIRPDGVTIRNYKKFSD